MDQQNDWFVIIAVNLILQVPSKFNGHCKLGRIVEQIIVNILKTIKDKCINQYYLSLEN